MSKYKITEKFNDKTEASGEPKLTKKFRRKGTAKGDLHPRSRSLSLGSLSSPQLTLTGLDMDQKMPAKFATMDFLQLTNLNVKGNPYTYDNMYGYKDQYDCVGKHTDKGIDFLENYSSFLKKRCEIETSYARDLKRLVRNFQPKKKDEEDNQFSWARAFTDMLKELHDLAGQHEVIAENTQAQLIHDIQKCVQEMKGERKSYLAEGSKIQGQMKDSLKQLENSKKNYEKRFNEAERTLEAYRRADADINLSRADVEKTRATSNKRSQESEESKNEYAAQLQTTNQFQRDYYTSHMPKVFQNLQDMDERRINKIKTVIKSSANIEQNVLPIITTCIDGMVKSADSIDISEDSKRVIAKHTTGFSMPGDIPFEDLSCAPNMNNHNNVKAQTLDNKNAKGTIGKQKRQKGGIFNLFGSKSNPEEQTVPPAQRKKKLLQKMDELKAKIAHETAEREAMLKMKGVYESNPALGDPNSVNEKLEQSAEKLNALQAELRKNQDYVADIDGDMNMKRHGSDESMTHSITSEGSNNVQVSAPGTPVQQHVPVDEYYEPVEDPPPPMDPEPEPGTPDPDEFGYPVIGTCRALYPFDAVNDGSVTMTEGEEMYVLEQDQGDGWTRVRKSDDSEGFVPTSYIQCHFYDQDAV